MSAIRVLLVDDSLIARHLISRGLNALPGIEVVGTAASGTAALGWVSSDVPDIVILDYEMPGMNGVETLKRLRALHANLPVIVFSGAGESGAKVTIEALAAGASDYISKPTADGPGLEAIIAEDLAPKLFALCRRGPAQTAEARRERRLSMLSTSGALQVIAIASSTGGPNALARLLTRIPASLPVPIVIVQHMPPVFTRCLAERLDASCELSVREAHGGELLQAGDVWIAPGDFHLEVEGSAAAARIVLTQGPPENSCRPAADVLFRSVAALYGSGVLAAVLSGMGSDGLKGARAIVEARGFVLAQDQQTSTVWGMPKAVAEAGLADAVLPLDALADEIFTRAARNRARESLRVRP
jgi:two-component system, chemotaxis family, protein-glutamate methylesterase/glutaminase